MNQPKKRFQLNRRAFLRGAAGISVGLPFLEGLPERSAWAQDANPIYSFFIVQANGVIQDRYWPKMTGPLSAESMAGQACEPLAPYAKDLLFIHGLNHVGGNPGACGHAQGYVQTLTGAPPVGSGVSSQSGGPSMDWVISQELNPANTDPLTLYAGSHDGAYIAERTSFTGSGTSARPAQKNPWVEYNRLVGVPVGGGGGTTGGAEPTGDAVADLFKRKKSVNDVVLREFNSLVQRKELSAKDKQRLNDHMAGIRNLEESLMSTGDTMNDINDGNGNMAECGIPAASVDALSAYENYRFDTNSHMIEDIVKLHAEIVAVNFACGLNRTATLQWGDGTDPTSYNTVSTGGYSSFHKISHQTNSDATAGNDAFAAEAHREIDIIRNETFAHIVKTFSERGLFGNSFIFLTNSIGVGTFHGFDNIPSIIAGSAGGFFKQGEFIKVPSRTKNSKLMASLVTAAGVPTQDFGQGGGQLTDAHA